MRNPASKPIQTMKVSWRDAQTAAERLRHSDGEARPTRERRGLRVPFKVANLTVAIAHPNGSTTVYSVIPRNLSTQGFAFLHGRFLYIGSPCRVELPTLDGRAAPALGKVVHCRHVSGIMHEVAVRFDAPVELSNFVALSDEEREKARSEYDDAANESGHDRAASSATLRGKALVVDGFQADRELLRLRLTKLGLCVSTAESLDAARAQWDKEKFDVVMLDPTLCGAKGKEVVDQIRAQGATKAIIALSTDDAPEHRETALAAGFDAYLVKPIDVATLTQALSDSLGGGAEAVLSSMRDEPDMLPLIESYVADAQRMVASIEASLEKDDTTSLLRIAKQLKGSGSSHGYEMLTRAAGLAVERLGGETSDAESAQAAVRDLVKVMRRIAV